MVATVRLFRFGIVITVLFGIFVASSHAEDQPAGLSEIPKQMLSFVEKHQISGAVMLVAEDGQVVHLEAVGLADVEANRSMEKDAIFPPHARASETHRHALQAWPRRQLDRGDRALAEPDHQGSQPGPVGRSLLHGRRHG